MRKEQHQKRLQLLDDLESGATIKVEHKRRQERFYLVRQDQSLERKNHNMIRALHQMGYLVHVGPNLMKLSKLGQWKLDHKGERDLYEEWELPGRLCL